MKTGLYVEVGKSQCGRMGPNGVVGDLGAKGVLRINSAKTPGAEGEQKQARGSNGCAGISQPGPARR